MIITIVFTVISSLVRGRIMQVEVGNAHVLTQDGGSAAIAQENRGISGDFHQGCKL